MSATKSIEDLEEDLKDRLDHMHRELAKARQRISALEDELEDSDNSSGDVPDDVQERLDALEDEVKRASATNDEQKASKLEKIEAVVRHAQSKGSGGIAGVQIEYGEVIAAADCSRQWAHTLMDEIGATYSWASTKAPSGKKKQLRIRTDDHSLEEMLDDVYGGQG